MPEKRGLASAGRAPLLEKVDCADMTTKGAGCDADVGKMEVVTGHVVVIGCAGFIGSHLSDRLLVDGHTVAGIDSSEDGVSEMACVKAPLPVRNVPVGHWSSL